jgi:deoxyribose-phosphate aldolase
MGPTANDATIGDEMTNDDSAAIAQLIDHTLLKADATQDQIAQLCYEARTTISPPCASTRPTCGCAPNC